MRQLVVISGKGGTGKTSVTACLARLAAEEGGVTLADCDVDAANLGLLFPGEPLEEHPFVAGRRAVVEADACTACGQCEEACRFGAIHVDEVARPDDLRCEGCGACAVVCADGAISFRPNRAGRWMVRQTEVGPLVHAELGPAEDNSGKLVSQVRQSALEIAEREGHALVLVDGPPGIGCPVHAAVARCDLALVVTEPTPSGEHDLLRVLDLAEHFRIPAALLINKHDLSPEISARVEEVAGERGVPVVGRLPFDVGVPRALAQGLTPLHLPGFGDTLRAAWAQIATTPPAAERSAC